MYKSKFEFEIQRLDELIRSIDPNKKIVLVYHSFGSFVLGTYLNVYGLKHLKFLKGMIEISGSPIRFYMAARSLGSFVLSFQFQDLLEEGDSIHKFFMSSMKQTGFNLKFRDRYDTLSFMHFIKNPGFSELF